MAAKTVYNTHIYMTLGSADAVAFADEACTADATRKVYTITAATKNCWDDTASFVVEQNTGAGFTTVPATDYVLQYPLGKIVFTVARSVGTTVRVDGKYLPKTEYTDVTGATLDVKIDFADASTLADRWEKSMPAKTNATITLEGFEADGDFLAKLATRHVLVWTDGSATYGAFVYITSDSMKRSQGDIQKESVTFKVYGPVYKA